MSENGLSDDGMRNEGMSDGGMRPSAERRKRLRGRNIAVAIALVGLVVMFYVVTMIKLGAGVLVRPL